MNANTLFCVGVLVVTLFSFLLLWVWGGGREKQGNVWWGVCDILLSLYFFI